MAEYKQAGRLIKISTPLGEDKLLLSGLTGTEGISRLFHFHLDLLSTDDNIDPDDIVGKPVSISVEFMEDQPRYIHGRISSFSQGHTTDRFTEYQAEMVPWLWFLTRKADLRIFQEKTVLDIIKDVFDRGGFQDLSDRTTKTYPALEYCVQYRESDFNFVSRLMEHYGIYYYFKHEESKHTLVMADTPQGHEECPESSSFTFDTTAAFHEEEDVVQSWLLTEEFRPGKYALQDYNFKTPKLNLKVHEEAAISLTATKSYEVYDYPGDYLVLSEGDTMARTRMEEEETPFKIIHGTGTCRPFTSGHKFTLKEHPKKALNAAYVLTEVNHSASVGNAYATGSDGRAEGERYSNHFRCIPAAVPFRPPRVTPKPFVQGPQTAVVVGPSGEEIYTDKYGRVKVQFYWDRVGTRDENSSCWMRVSQPWAGQSWGSIWTPRVGQEVVVDFLEGDPDRPLITGRLYNEEQKVPYKLPDHKTVSTFKSNSSKGGGGSNELRFEDNKEKEQIYLHAERDLDVRVKDESREYVGKNRHLVVEQNQLENVGGNRHEEIKKDHVEKVGMNLHVKVGMNHEVKVGVKYAVDAGAEIHLKAGANCVIEATAGLTLKVGGSYITLLPALIAIQGSMVLINSGGAALPGSGASPGSPDAPDKADYGDKFDKG